MRIRDAALTAGSLAVLVMALDDLLPNQMIRRLTGVQPLPQTTDARNEMTAIHGWLHHLGDGHPRGGFRPATPAEAEAAAKAEALTGDPVFGRPGYSYGDGEGDSTSPILLPDAEEYTRPGVRYYAVLAQH